MLNALRYCWFQLFSCFWSFSSGLQWINNPDWWEAFSDSCLHCPLVLILYPTTTSTELLPLQWAGSPLFVLFVLFFTKKSGYVCSLPCLVSLHTPLCVAVTQMWQFAPNSVHYLLGLWQRMVASVPYVKATEPHLLETYTPEVTKAYVSSRLESVHSVIRSVRTLPCQN